MSPTESPSPAAKRPRRRRWLVVLGVVAGVLVATWFLRGRLLARVVTSLAKSRAGLDVRFEGLAVEGVARITARHVRVRALEGAGHGAGEVLRSADVEDLTIDVDVRGLWSDVVVLEAVRARAVRADLDLRPRPDAAPSRGGGGGLPDTWPEVFVEDLDLDVATAAGRARLRGARVALDARHGTALSGATRLAIDARALVVMDGGREAGGPLSLRAAVEDGGVAVEHASWTGVAEVRAARWMPDPQGGFDASLALDTRIGSADLEARADAADVRVRGTLVDVDLPSVLRILGENPEDWGGAWTARGSFVLPRARPSRWTADADVAARAPRIAGRDADRIEGRFLATERHYEARDVLALAGANTAAAALVRVERDADLGCEFLDHATIQVEADLRDVAAILGDAWTLPAGAPPHRVTLAGALADRALWIGSGTAEIGASRIELDATRIPLAGGARLALLDRATELEFGIRAPDSGELARLLLPADVAAELGLSGSVTGSVRLRSTNTGVAARLALRAMNAAIRGIAIDELTARAGVEDGRLEIERLDLAAGPTQVRASGAVDLRAKRFAGLEVEADVPDLRDLSRALGLAAELPLGRARVTARLDGPLAAPEGALSAEADDVRVGALDVAWLRLRAHGEAGGIAVDELAAELPLFGTVASAGHLEHTARGAWVATISRLGLTALDGSATLARPARLSLADGLLALEDFDFGGGDGAVRANASRTRDSLCADLAFESSRIGRVLRAFDVPVPRSLRLDGRATVELSGLVSGDVQGHVDAALSASVADLGDLSLPHGFRATGTGSARVELAGPWNDARGSLLLAARELGLIDAAGGVRLAGAALNLDARVDDAIVVESFHLDLTRGARIDATGGAQWPLDLARLARGDFGHIEDAALELALRAEAPDLEPLADAFEILRRTRGSLAADLELAGTLAEPRLSGTVLLRGGGVKLSAALPSVSDVELDLRVAPDRVTIERASGAYGGGLVELTGTVGIDGAEPVLDLGLRGTSIPLLRSAEISLRSDLDVRVSGPWSALALRGAARLSDARFEQRIDLERLRTLFESKPDGAGGRVLELPAITDPPFHAMTLQLDVRSDKPVRVRTPLLRAEVLTGFHVRGVGAAPILEGWLELAGGRIALPAAKLELVQGRVDFDPADPGRARLDVTAEGRASGYDVTARVTGTTDEPIVELSSIPPASEEDLTLLLLAGRVPGSRGLSLDQDRVVGEVASYFARDLAYEWFGDAGESFADRLELATGADVTQSGADTIEVRFRLTGPGRGAGKAVYLRGERDVYDRVNMGVRFVLRMP